MTRQTYIKTARPRLAREAKVYSLLPIGPAYAASGFQIHLPRLVSWQPGRLVLERIAGKPASLLPASLALSAMLAVFTYLTWLNQQISPAVKKRLRSRPAWFYPVSYPFFLIKAAAANPSARRDLFKSAAAFLDCLPAILFQKSDILAHGDLVLDNILVSRRKLHLIDWEYAAVTVPLYDLAYAVVYSKNASGRFRWRLFQALKPQNLFLFRGLAIYIATQALSVSQSPAKLDQYRECLTKSCT